MSDHDVHAAIIARQQELTELADTYDNASKTLRQILNLEIELKMPNLIVINRLDKEEKLKELKQYFNELQIIYLFSRNI